MYIFSDEVWKLQRCTPIVNLILGIGRIIVYHWAEPLKAVEAIIVCLVAFESFFLTSALEEHLRNYYNLNPFQFWPNLANIAICSAAGSAITRLIISPIALFLTSIHSPEEYSAEEEKVDLMYEYVFKEMVFIGPLYSTCLWIRKGCCRRKEINEYAYTALINLSSSLASLFAAAALFHYTPSRDIRTFLVSQSMGDEISQGGALMAKQAGKYAGKISGFLIKMVAASCCLVKGTKADSEMAFDLTV